MHPSSKRLELYVVYSDFSGEFQDEYCIPLNFSHSHCGEHWAGNENGEGFQAGPSRTGARQGSGKRVSGSGMAGPGTCRTLEWSPSALTLMEISQRCVLCPGLLPAPLGREFPCQVTAVCVLPWSQGDKHPYHIYLLTGCPK